MRHSVGGRDSLKDFEAGTEREVAGYVTAAIGEGALELKAEWRSQIEKAKLGRRLANSVRSEVYPKGQPSADAAALIWTKAPDIIDAYSRGVTIRPVNGSRYLWIPTDSVSKKRQGNRLSPREVEAQFGRPMIIVSPKDWRMKLTTTAFGKAVAYAGYRQLAIRKASGRLRNASVNERTKGHRSYKEVSQQFWIMFSLVPSVSVEKRLDLQVLAAGADARFPGLLSKHWR